MAKTIKLPISAYRKYNLVALRAALKGVYNRECEIQAYKGYVEGNVKLIERATHDLRYLANLPTVSKKMVESEIEKARKAKTKLFNADCKGKQIRRKPKKKGTK